MMSAQKTNVSTGKNKNVSTSKKSERLQIRISPENKEELRDLVKKDDTHTSLSEYILDHVLTAEKTQTDYSNIKKYRLVSKQLIQFFDFIMGLKHSQRNLNKMIDYMERNLDTTLIEEVKKELGKKD